MKKLLLVLVLIGGSLVGLVYWLNASQQVHLEENMFTFAQVNKGAILETVSATGAVKPRDLVVLTSDSPGTVVQVLADVNSVVHEGDVLVKLDDQLAKLKVEQARIGVTTAQAALDQALALEGAAVKSLKYHQDLAKSGFRKDLEKAEVELKAAQAGIKVAQARLQDTKNLLEQAEYAHRKLELRVHTLPSSLQTGMGSRKQEYLVLERNVKVGQMVGPMAPTPLFVLAGDLAQMELHTEVVEGDIGRVKAGQLVQFTINSYEDPDLIFEGTVREVFPVPTSVQGAVYYNAVIDVANQKHPATNEWRLLPGMTTSVDIVVRKQPDSWKVPIAAFSFRMEEEYQSPAARQHLARWQQQPDAKDWQPLWVWQSDHERAWPIFVRVSDSTREIRGIQDGEYHEILEWEPGTEPAPGNPNLKIIIGAPPVRQPGLLDRPANIKLS